MILYFDDLGFGYLQQLGIYTSSSLFPYPAPFTVRFYIPCLDWGMVSRDISCSGSCLPGPHSLGEMESSGSPILGSCVLDSCWKLLALSFWQVAFTFHCTTEFFCPYLILEASLQLVTDPGEVTFISLLALGYNMQGSWILCLFWSDWKVICDQ